MTKKFALLGAVWGAGLLAAVAAWKVHQPPVPTTARVEPVPQTRAVVVVPAPTTFIQMTPVTILGNPPRAAPKPPAPTLPPPKKVVHCSEWRDLTQGPSYSQVRVCE